MDMREDIPVTPEIIQRIQEILIRQYCDQYGAEACHIRTEWSGKNEDDGREAE